MAEKAYIWVLETIGRFWKNNPRTDPAALTEGQVKRIALEKPEASMRVVKWEARIKMAQSVEVSVGLIINTCMDFSDFKHIYLGTYAHSTYIEGNPLEPHLDAVRAAAKKDKLPHLESNMKLISRTGHENYMRVPKSQAELDEARDSLKQHWDAYVAKYLDGHRQLIEKIQAEEKARAAAGEAGKSERRWTETGREGQEWAPATKKINDVVHYCKAWMREYVDVMPAGGDIERDSMSPFLKELAARAFCQIYGSI